MTFLSVQYTTEFIPNRPGIANSAVHLQRGLMTVDLLHLPLGDDCRETQQASLQGRAY